MPARRKKNEPTVSFIESLNILEQERGIQKSVVIEALKESLEKGYKKQLDLENANVNVDIDEMTGRITVSTTWDVVDKSDVLEDFHMDLDTARTIDPNCQIGDQVTQVVPVSEWGRLAANQTKQLLRQKIREAEKDALYEAYRDKQDEIINGIVERVEPPHGSRRGFAIINIGKTGAFLPEKEMIEGEVIEEKSHLKVYVKNIEKTTKGTHIELSRTAPGFVKRLFEELVPEVESGQVVIHQVSREAGKRSKMSVSSEDPDIDPIGSCVGQKGARVGAVVEELHGEQIDIILWDEDPHQYITNALSPAKVNLVVLYPNRDVKSEDEEDRRMPKMKGSALVIVPDDQLSLAIGKKGQNARLAVRLTGWKIDIKSETEARELQLDLTEPVYEEPVVEEVVEEPVVEEVVETVETPETVETVGEPEAEETVEEVKTAPKRAIKTGAKKREANTSEEAAELKKLLEGDDSYDEGEDDQNYINVIQQEDDYDDYDNDTEYTDYGDDYDFDQWDSYYDNDN